jgi:predicted nucleic acid-binding protein
VIIVDTNAVVALVLNTEATTLARAWLRHDADWHAPHLLLSELRNVLLGEVRRNNLAAVDCAAIADAVAQQIRWAPPPPSADVVAAALSGGLSAYDAEFVAVAQTAGVRLLTGDSAILRAYPSLTLSLRSPPADRA